jgi:hypothetical protein
MCAMSQPASLDADHLRDAPASVEADDVVRALLAAAARHDLIEYHSRLHDDFVERVDGVVVADTARHAALTTERVWSHARDARVRVDDIAVVDDIVTVRFVLFDGIRYDDLDGATPGSFVGYSVYEVAGHRVASASHFFAPLRHAPTSDAIAPADTGPDEVAAPKRSLFRRLALPLAGVGSWLLQELVLATPIVAMANATGKGVTFATLATAYFCVSLLLSVLVLRRLANAPDDKVGRLGQWFRRTAEERSGWARRLFAAGSTIGFVIGAFYVGGPVTAWVLHTLGVKGRRLNRLTGAANAIWSIGFVGFYCGLSAIVF